MGDLATQMRKGQIMMDNVFELLNYDDDGGMFQLSIWEYCYWLTMGI